MKIAILTIIDFTNYGNRLQNYALQAKIKEIYKDAEVDTIGGCSKHILSYVYPIISPLTFVPILKRKKKMIKNDNSKTINLDRYSKKKLSMLNDKYDAFVIGSDQIWNPGYVENPFVKFAMFADSEKCMAYSASFGVNEIKKKNVKAFIEGLNHIPYISTREIKGQELVKTLTGKDVPVVLDPTLLLNKLDWQKYAKPVNGKPKSYILTYGFSLPKVFREYVDKVAKKYNLEVININKFSNKFTTVTAQEFIDIILNAKLVCTNSFHGHALSIALEKPFVSFSSKQVSNSRITSILKITGLENRNYKTLKEEDLFKLDYQGVNDRLNKEREKSMEFLKKSLESILNLQKK